jgi:hypothetical protein
MEIRQAHRIVRTLAQGVDPNSGEVFAPDSPYNEPTIIRALFTVCEFVRQAKKPRLTPQDLRRENLDRGRPRNYGLPWTDDLRTHIATQFGDGKTIEELAVDLERTEGAIRAELIRQGLLPPDFRSA